MSTKMAKAEMELLAALNIQRAPLQEKLLKEAERLFEIWNQLNPTTHGTRYFKSAEFQGPNQWDESEIRISCETGCSCSGRCSESEEIQLPLEAFLNAEWEQDARATIEKRKSEERRLSDAETERKERKKMNELMAQYVNVL